MEKSSEVAGIKPRTNLTVLTTRPPPQPSQQRQQRCSKKRRCRCRRRWEKNRIKNEDEAHQWKKILQRLHKFSSIYFKRSKLESQERPSWRYDFLLSHSFFPLSLSLSYAHTRALSQSLLTHTHTHTCTFFPPFFLSLPPTPTHSIPFLLCCCSCKSGEKNFFWCCREFKMSRLSHE